MATAAPRIAAVAGIGLASTAVTLPVVLLAGCQAPGQPDASSWHSPVEAHTLLLCVAALSDGGRVAGGPVERPLQIRGLFARLSEGLPDLFELVIEPDEFGLEVGACSSPRT